MEQTRIVIAEQEQEFRKELSSRLSKYAEMAVVGETDNGLEALNMVAKLQPDVLITNVLLPRYDGLMLVEKINKIGLRRPEQIIFISSLSTENYIQSAFAVGADEYLIKPVSAELVAQKIRQRKKRIDKQEKLYTGDIAAPLAIIDAEEAEEKIRHEISSLLMRIGFPAHLHGFRFIKEAVLILMKDPTMLKDRTKVLYPIIGQKYGTSSFSVERAIRHAISIVWEQGAAIRYRNEYTGIDELYLPLDRPATGELVALIAEFLSSHPQTASLLRSLEHVTAERSTNPER